MLKLLFSFFLVLLSCCSWGQKQSANWYFGKNAGLNFSSASPQALTDGQLQQEEGSATISDANGNLLFYTDGTEVYNAAHQLMPNGSGLLGDESSTQSAIIVPQPGSATRYCIITTAAQGGSNGLNYSVVDISLQGGLGDVIPTEKNIQLDGFVAEKITAVYHANLQDVWVVSHRLDNNEFISFLITASGITTTPVVSATGSIYTSAMPTGTGALGYLKASPNGKKLASAVTYVAPGLQLFDFNNQTGQVSNPLSVNTFFNYGVEFSPDSKILYSSVFSALAGRIFQYDISSGDLATIQSTQLLIAPDIKYGGLQLAMDGKIYAAQPGYTSLAVIENPNVVGVGCSFIEDSVSLSGMESRLGLPPFIQSYFQFNIVANNVCFGEAAKLEIKSYKIPVAVQWNFGDPASGIANVSQKLTPEHEFSSPGTYTVTAIVVTVSGETVTITEKITILKGAEAHFPGNIQLCDESGNDGVTGIDLNSYTTAILGDQRAVDYTVQYYKTQADAGAGVDAIAITTPFFNSVNPQTVYSLVTNISTGCKAMTSFTLTVNPKPQLLVNLPQLHTCDIENSGIIGYSKFDLTQNEQSLLNGETGMNVTYFETHNKAELGIEIIDNPSIFKNTVANQQTIYVRVTNPVSGCYSIVSFDIVVDPLPSSILEDAALCIDVTTGQASPVVLDTGLETGYNFVWTKDGKPIGSADGAITVNEPGIYNVVITNSASGCTIIDKATVVVSSGAVATAEVGSDFDDRQTITVHVIGGSGSYEYRLNDGDYQNEPYFTGNYDGEYTIRVRDKNGCQQLELTVYALNYPRFFSPNQDGHRDYWNIRSLRDQKGIYITIFDRYGKILDVIKPQASGWDGTFKGQNLPATDYWFKFDYRAKDGNAKEFNGHFSLLR